MSFSNIGGNSTLFDATTSALARVSPFGQLNTSELTLIAGGVWDGAALDAVRWSSTILNAATSVVGAGINTMATGTSANASIKVHSTKVARFFPNTPHLVVADVKFGDTGTVNNTRRWGAFDDNNGVFFQLSGTTFGCVTRKATADTVVTSLSGTAFTPDINYHVFEILFNEGKVFYIIDKILRHTATFSTTLWADTLNLKIGYENTNSGGSTSNLNMVSRSAALYRFGRELSSPMFSNLTASSTTTVLSSGPVTLQKVIINDQGTSSATLSLYDAVTATNPIGIIDIVNCQAGETIEYGIPCNVGLCAVTSANFGNCTVVFS